MKPIMKSQVLSLAWVLLLVSSGRAYTPAMLADLGSPYSQPWEFGHSVASAGDWNGDGYQDLIVGFEDDE